MTGALGRLGDQLLERLVPKATAKADASWIEVCYCRNLKRYKRECHVVGGTTGCTSCYLVDVWIC